MNFIKNNMYKFITSKRSLVEFHHFLNDYTFLNFAVGMILSGLFTWCYFNTGFMFKSGLLIGLGIGLFTVIELFCSFKKSKNSEYLKSLRFVTFENTHYITNETKDKCCGEKIHFCGWVFGVTNTHGLRSKSTVKQEMHATIKGTKLTLLIPSAKLKRKHLFNSGTISHDIFKYKRIIELRNSEIKCYPVLSYSTNQWGFKYPICITLSDLNKNFSGQIEKEYRWKSINSLEENFIESKFKIFQCKTKLSTLDYLRCSKRKLHKVYFCAISCREKEMWFRNLVLASVGIRVNYSLWKTLIPFMSSSENENSSKNVSKKSNELYMSSFIRYLAKFMPSDWILMQHKYPVPLTIPKIVCHSNLLWLNALCARLFWGFMEEGFLVKKIIRKLHNKIKKIHLPIYIEEISIENVDIGYNMPIITNIERPVLDTSGFWCDINVDYDGGLSLSLVTKVDLMKLKDQQRKPKKVITSENVATSFHLPALVSSKKKKFDHFAKHRVFRESIISKFEISKHFLNNSHTKEKRRSFRFIDKDRVISESSSEISGRKEPAFDSNEEDSNETDEIQNEVEYSGEKTIKHFACFKYESKTQFYSPNIENRILRIIEKLGRSKYFLKATRNKYIKKGIEMFASKKILLQLDIHHFDGTMVVHIPRPPSDRLWYGLRPMPNVKLSTIPKIGDRQLNFSKITDWIQKKVMSELEQLLVLPNMDDLKIPQ